MTSGGRDGGVEGMKRDLQRRDRGRRPGGAGRAAEAGKGARAIRWPKAAYFGEAAGSKANKRPKAAYLPQVPPQWPGFNPLSGAGPLICRNCDDSTHLSRPEPLIRRRCTRNGAIPL